MTTPAGVRVLAVDGSPSGGGRTEAAIKAVLAGAESAGARTVLQGLAGSDDSALDSMIAAMAEADAFVFGSPIYRASFAGPLKLLLDRLPRGMWGEQQAPLQGKAVAIVATGASLHHFLALNDLRNVLAGFFAAHVLPPGLYVPREGFQEDGTLAAPYREQAALQGRALVELAQALAASSALRELRPQA
jgi:FMN reductase